MSKENILVRHPPWLKRNRDTHLRSILQKNTKLYIENMLERTPSMANYNQGFKQFTENQELAVKIYFENQKDIDAWTQYL